MIPIDPLLAAAEAVPGALALEDAAVRRTYGELAECAASLAGGLREGGVGPGDRVGLLAADGVAAAESIHAIRLAGAVLVPLNRRLPATTLRELVERVGARFVLVDEAHAAALDGPRILRLGSLTGRPCVDPAQPDRPAAILFTSGTSGSPKGAVLSGANLVASAMAWNGFLGARAEDRWLAAVPLFHVAGLGILYRAALARASIRIHDRFDPAAVLRALAGDRIAFVSLVPTQLAALLDHGPLEAPALRGILLGGAPIPPDLVRRAVDARLPVVPTYGLTEAASGVTALVAAEAASVPGSSGRPLPGVSLRIDAPPGGEGEILVQGPMVFAGYDGDEAATAEALDADGWLHTGDVGVLDTDGRLTVLDRRDDLFVSGGENIYPAQAEAALAASPLVADVAVAGRPHERWGRVPVAVVVPALRETALPGPELAAELGRYARERLPRHAVPAGFVIREALPRTATGKIRRQEVTAIVETALTLEHVDRPDGARIAVRRRGSGPPLVLCHATLSTAAELDLLADRLGERFTVLAVDRRSAGASELPPGIEPGPIDVAVHVADLLGVLDDAGLAGPALLVGHSYGGCVALEAAARHPARFAAVWVFEPPYVPLGPATVQRAFAGLGERIATIATEEGEAAAALAFLEAVAGESTVARLPDAVRGQIGREGRSAVADAALAGLDPGGLARITAPVEVAVGGRSHPFYARIGAGIASAIPGATIVGLDDLSHAGPASRPEVVADAILDLARRHGLAA